MIIDDFAHGNARLCQFLPLSGNSRYSSGSVGTGASWRRTSPRPSTLRRIRCAAIFAFSQGAASAGASTAARCQSRRASGPALARGLEGTARKAALGAALAALAAPGQFVFIDAGSTNLAAARRLPQNLGLTVATHDPAIAAALAGRSDLSLWLIGGRIDPHVGAALGGRALSEIAAMRPDLVLIGVCAVDPAAGIAAFSAEDAEFKRTLIRNAGRSPLRFSTRSSEPARPS